MVRSKKSLQNLYNPQLYSSVIYGNLFLLYYIGNYCIAPNFYVQFSMIFVNYTEIIKILKKISL